MIIKNLNMNVPSLGGIIVYPRSDEILLAPFSGSSLWPQILLSAKIVASTVSGR